MKGLFFLCVIKLWYSLLLKVLRQGIQGIKTEELEMYIHIKNIPKV